MDVLKFFTKRKQSTQYFFRAILKRGIITQGKNILGEINKQRDGLVKLQSMLQRSALTVHAAAGKSSLLGYKKSPDV